MAHLVSPAPVNSRASACDAVTLPKSTLASACGFARSDVARVNSSIGVRQARDVARVNSSFIGVGVRCGVAHAAVTLGGR